MEFPDSDDQFDKWTGFAIKALGISIYFILVFFFPNSVLHSLQLSFIIYLYGIWIFITDIRPYLSRKLKSESSSKGIINLLRFMVLIWIFGISALYRVLLSRYGIDFIFAIFIFGFGFGFPIWLSFIWISWIQKTKNAFRFFQKYLTITQVLQSLLVITFSWSYFTDAPMVYQIALQSPSRYWYFYVYLLFSVVLILIYLTKIGRSLWIARFSEVLWLLNLPLSLGVIFILPDNVNFNVSFSLVIFVFISIFSFCLGIIQNFWGLVFGKLPWTLYLTDKGFETNIYNENTLSGMITKLLIESLKEVDFIEDSDMPKS